MNAEFVCNGNSTNWSIVKNVFLDKLVLSGRNDKRLCHSLQVVLLHGSICKQVHSFLVLIVFESNMTSVKQTISNSETNVGVVTNHEKLGRARIRRSLAFTFGYGNSEREKKSIPSSPYNIKPSVLLSIFILLIKKGFRKNVFHILIRKFIIVVTPAVQTPLFPQIAALKLLVM